MRFWVAAVAAFLGALIWAKSQDPLVRLEFKLKVAGSDNLKGIAIIPKPIQPYPVVVYLHGSGENSGTDGNELRQFAELGMAAVQLKYDQTDAADFGKQLMALSHYLQKQPWALGKATAWVGFSPGAEMMLNFVLTHPKQHPQLLACLSGGGVLELDDQFKGAGSPSSYSLLRTCPVLLVHGENDKVFPMKEQRLLEGLLRRRGIPVTMKVLPERDHQFNRDRPLMIRLVGEYCKSILTPSNPFPEAIKRSTLPFWACLMPAGILATLWLWARGRRAIQPNCDQRGRHPLIWGEKGLRWLAGGLALLVMGDAALRVALAHLAVSPRTLEIARRFLVSPKWRDDFDSLATNTVWTAKPLKLLLDNAELANYNRNELSNWKVDDQIYRQFVLSPLDAAGSAEELNWRRPLWESFYPRIRHERTPKSAAEIVVRYLRERVTVRPQGGPQAEPPVDGDATIPGVETIWNQHITDEKGFETIYVAALRSVGIGARLNMSGMTEFWTGDDWVAAPRPMSLSFLPVQGS